MEKFLYRQLRQSVNYAKTVDHNEMEHFTKFASQWWDLNGNFKLLHTFNKLRVPFIRDGLINTRRIEVTNQSPFKDLEILDVGCGGGILCEPISRLGANVTGLDPNPEAIQQAECHAAKEKLNIKYNASTIEEHAIKNVDKYDAVVASEVIEHVTEKQEFLRACVTCLKPGGSIFLTTFSQTYLARFVGIFMGEYVLGLLPKGTHEFSKFIKPHNLQRMLEEENCRTVLIHGIFMNCLTNQFQWIPITSVNYALHAIKLPKTNYNQ